MSKLTETKTWGMCYYIYILKAGKDKNTNDRKKTKTKKAETQKDNHNNKRFNIDMSGQFHNLVMLLKRRQGSHLPGILNHPSQQVQLQPLHVDQLLRSHTPDVWLGELPFFNTFLMIRSHTN